MRQEVDCTLCELPIHIIINKDVIIYVKVPRLWDTSDCISIYFVSLTAPMIALSFYWIW